MARRNSQVSPGACRRKPRIVHAPALVIFVSGLKQRVIRKENVSCEAGVQSDGRYTEDPWVASRESGQTGELNGAFRSLPSMVTRAGVRGISQGKDRLRRFSYASHKNG